MLALEYILDSGPAYRIAQLLQLALYLAWLCP